MKVGGSVSRSSARVHFGTTQGFEDEEAVNGVEKRSLIGRPSDGEAGGVVELSLRAALTNSNVLWLCGVHLCGELVCKPFSKTFLRLFWSVTFFKKLVWNLNEVLRSNTKKHQKN